MQAKEKSRPNIPARPVAEFAEHEEEGREEPGKDSVRARTDGAKDVATIELSGGEEVQRSGEKTDPGSAADRVEQEGVRGCAWMNDGSEKTQQERSAENDLGVGRVRDAGNDLGVEKAEDEGRHGENESHERAGGADIEEGAGGANGRAHEDKSAEGADERGEGNEKGVAGVNVVMPASEEVAQFVCEENR